MKVWVVEITDEETYDVQLRSGDDELWINCIDKQGAEALAAAICRHSLYVERGPNKSGKAGDFEK